MAEPYGCGTVGLFTVLWCGKAYHGLGPFCQVFPAQVGYSVFRNQIIGLETGRHHACARCKNRLYLVCAFVGGGQHCQEREAAFAARCTVDEIMLSVLAREE